MLCRQIRLTERRFRTPREVASSEGPIIRPCSTRDQPIECTTPRTSRARNIEPHPKTPLIIITLEAPTLAPRDIKRDPKKPPPFCQQYLSITKSIDSDDRRSNIPEFYIQGVEIAENKIELETSDEENFSNISFECHHGEIIPIDQTGKLILNYDGYEMDCYGHLPMAETRTPTPTPLPSGYRPLCLRRTPSPTTRQIIRVDVTMNRTKVKK